MKVSHDLDLTRHEAALKSWLDDCRRRWEKRYPLIAFDDDDWRLRTLHGSTMVDESLRPTLTDFAGKAPSFGDGLRCIVAEVVLSDSAKTLQQTFSAFRLLKNSDAQTLFDLSPAEFRKVETHLLKIAEFRPASASSALNAIANLVRQFRELVQKGVIPKMIYTVRKDVMVSLTGITKMHRERNRISKAMVLDHQIEALSEATTALFQDDPRLSAIDRVAIAALNLEMCAPSRVNEILCLAIDDHVVLDDFQVLADGQQTDGIYRIHQMLVMTMKGSKGSQWGAKPILNFMIELFNLCIKIIMKHGERSRTLVSWYQKNPDTLYLPAALEHLRGRDVDRYSLWQIVNLTDRQPDRYINEVTTAQPIMNALREKGAIKRIENPRPILRNGKKASHATVEGASWVDVEACLLERVHSSIGECRRVTRGNFYEGDLAKMLFLFDSNQTPYLPAATKYKNIRRRLKLTTGETTSLMKRGIERWEPTLFEKLGITMPVHGKVQVAWIDTHDPRRWLTTTALSAREKLSDVMINKWACRLSIDQLKHYDLRTAEQKADQSSMPAVLELDDLSKGIESARAQEERFGLRTEIVTVHDAGISVTSMDAIAAAVEQRPIAKTSEQLFIIYPSWFGACIHQHHETPCRAYSASCLPCDNNLVVKGHLPTNEAVRSRERLLHGSIVEQLEKLVMAQNRGVPDNPAALDEHLLTLVCHGLNSQQMANDLIDRFHEIKHLIKDVCFANKLEEAFVASGMVVRLDDPEVANGALIKYHNPTRHAAPGRERAWDAHGGHERLGEARERLIHTYPMFAPTAEGLRDQRGLMPPDNDEDDAIQSVEDDDSGASHE